MRTSLLLILLTVVSAFAAESEIVPTDPKTPLFQLYETQVSPPKKSDPDAYQMRLKKVLLTVFTLDDLRFSRDESDAQAILNRKDARVFSQLTHAHKYLVLVAGDQKASVVMHITAPIDDGVVADEQSTIDLYFRWGLIKQKLDAAEIVDRSFADAIAKAGL